MVALSNVVSVSSTVQDAAAKAANFGTIAIFAETTAFVGWRDYDATAAGLAAMVTDGFGTYHGAKVLATAIASANPGVTKLRVYARAAANGDTVTYNLIPTNTTDGYVYTFEVNGTAITHTNSTDTVETIIDSLQTQINAIAGITATDNITDLDVAADDPAVAGVYIDLSNEPNITLIAGSTDGGIATDFAAAVTLSDAFYGVLVADCHSQAQIAAMSALAESAGKFFVAQLVDTDVETSSTTDAGSDNEAAGYHRTFLLRSRDMLGAPHAGLMARQFSRNPGSSNWDYQQVAGAASDNWTATAYGHILGKNVGMYLNFAPANSDDSSAATHNIRAGSGRYPDITRGVDWLDSNLGTAILTELLAQEKVANNGAGRAGIEKAMSAIFKQGERFGLLEPDWTITVPPKAEQSASDKANRILGDVKYTATLSGALNNVTVAGTLSI